MPCTRVLSVLLVVVLGGAVPASAAFTPAETTSLQHVFSAATDDLHAGMGELFPVIRATNSATRPSTAAGHCAAGGTGPRTHAGVPNIVSTTGSRCGSRAARA